MRVVIDTNIFMEEYTKAPQPCRKHPKTTLLCGFDTWLQREAAARRLEKALGNDGFHKGEVQHREDDDPDLTQLCENRRHFRQP